MTPLNTNTPSPQNRRRPTPTPTPDANADRPPKQKRQVYKGRRRATGRVVALKFIAKTGKSERDLRNLRQEIEILRDLRHENIIQMLDAFETRTDFVVVMGA